MKLSKSADLCDAIEMGALAGGKTFSQQQILRQFFPGSKDAKHVELIRDALDLAFRRKRACGPAGYPFHVEPRSIRAEPVGAFTIYYFLLFGRTLMFGGPASRDVLLRSFRKYFEDVVCWALRRAGFTADVLSEPREPRGLHVKLFTSLNMVKERFGERATLKVGSLAPGDNDLDVDVLAVPRPGNRECGGWPIFLIQCATGAITTLQSKIGEGQFTFNTVWEGGFFRSHSVRGVATPDCLLTLSVRDWNRLSEAGWVLDRTRIVHLATFGQTVSVPNDVKAFWRDLAAASLEIDWQTGWQGENQSDMV
jgi:hypothetical protein